MDRWRAYEAEWRDIPNIEDMAAMRWGFFKAKPAEEIPMTREEFFRRQRAGEL
jgi:hypothetical protein